MKRIVSFITVLSVTSALFNGPVFADGRKERKVKSGTSVLVVNLANPRPDCSSIPGPIVLPSLREKPSNGTIQMQILVTDVAAAGNCPAPKVPTIALIYTPNKDFIAPIRLRLKLKLAIARPF